MKKYLFATVAVLTIAVAAAWNVNVNSLNENSSDVSLANMEALAGCIGSEFQVTPNGSGWTCVNNQGNSCCPY
jgi:hypothetical protein